MRAAAVLVAAALAAAACSGDADTPRSGPVATTSTSSTVPRPRDTPCDDVVEVPPTPSTAPPSDGEVLAGLEQLGVAETVNPVDDSTSIVIAVDVADQILCQAVAPALDSGRVFATVTGSGEVAVDLRMDVLVPPGNGPWPLVVFVPGGGFATAERTSALGARTYVAQAGFVVASVEYRVIGQGIYHDGVEDVKAAIRFLRAHAADYGIDPERVSVWGESAGGYLAAMVGVTNGLGEFDVGNDLDESSAVVAVADFYGLSDLTSVAADFDPDARLIHLTPAISEARYLHGARSGLSVLDLPAKGVQANPVTFVDRTDPPFLLVHGRRDPLVSPSQTLLLHTALTAAGVDSLRYVVEGAGHAGEQFTTAEVMDLLVGFLDQRAR